MKKQSILSFVFVFLLLVSCQNDDMIHKEATQKTDQSANAAGKAGIDETFIKENVAITDGRILSISKTEYVKQLVVINFSTTAVLPTQINFDNQEFFDDGLNNDLVAGDGTYTTNTKYPHSASVPFVTLNDSYSVLDNILIDTSFQHLAALDKKKGIGGGPTATLTCDIKWVCGCWGTCCGFQVSNCSFTIGWG